MIDGNYFVNDSDAIMSPDCNGGPVTITNNVFDQEVGATNEIILAGDNGDILDHNTFAAHNSAAPRFGNPNSCGLNTNATITNNILPNGISLTNSQSASTFTQDYNLITGGGTGAHTVTGTATYTGGGNPSTLAGFQLTAGSAGHNVASNGADIGYPFVAAPAPLPQIIVRNHGGNFCASGTTCSASATFTAITGDSIFVLCGGTPSATFTITDSI